MNELKIFENEEFGNIRTLEKSGKIFFCAKDVAMSLGYANTKDAIINHCRKDGVVFCDLIDNLGRSQSTKFIDEGNLYRLITHSKLPSADKFEIWVFDEVLPTIRQTGQYIIPPGEDAAMPMLLPDTKDYLTAARLVAHCPKERLRVVLKLLEKGGFDVSPATAVEMGVVSTSDIADRIEEAKVRSGLSYLKIGELLGLSSGQMSSYCNKQRFPRPERYQEMVAVLDML